MPTFTWTSGVPSTGALKTSKVSQKLFVAAIAECVAMQFVDSQPFGTGMGQSVTLPIISNLTEMTDYSLAETDRIPESSHTVSGKVVTVAEFGRAIPWTKFSEDLSVFDLKSSIQRKLKDDMKLQLDGRAFRAFKQTAYKYTPTGAAAASTATNGTAPTSATANMNVYHAEQIRDILFDTYKADFFDGSNYIGIFRTLGLRGIKRDPDWELWHQYTNPEAKYNSEVGRLEQIRFMETNHGTSTVGNAGLNIVGTSSVLGEGVVFGSEAVVMIESMSPQLVPGVPDDYGRIKSVAWYGQYEMSIVYDTATTGLLRVVHVTST